MKKRILSIAVITALLLTSTSVPTMAADTTDLGSSPVRLDICDGSITVVSGTDTITYTQGENSWTSTGGCVVTQSDTSGSTSNRIDFSAKDKDALEIKLTISGINIEAGESPIALNREVRAVLTLVGENSLVCTDTSSLCQADQQSLLLTVPAQKTDFL